MSNTALVKSKRDQLLESELRIQEATHDTIESVRTIGNELIKIETEELFEVMGKNDFKEYVEECLKFDYTVARIWMRAAPALELIDKQKLQLPYSQSQVVELVKLKEPNELIDVWGKVLHVSEEEKRPITTAMVRGAVAAWRTKTQERVTRARTKRKEPAKGIDIDLGTDGETPKRRSIWSEDGEKALNRLRRFCGDPIADAIDTGNPKISEKNLILWADQDADTVRNLAYFIVHKRWSLKKAMTYNESPIDADTTILELGELARSRGGKTHVEYEDIRLIIEIIA